MDRLRHLMLATAMLVAGCKEEAPAGPAPGRFAAVKSQRGEEAGKSFCEKTFPSTGQGARKFLAPPSREVPGLAKQAATGGNWTWVNLWATWCSPCMEEMALLGRWKESLSKDGMSVELELWSVDDDEQALKETLGKRKMPGRVEWLKGMSELPNFLRTLGVDPEAPIPIHALVDPAGMIRCVRVGQVHDRDYGAVKAIVASR